MANVENIEICNCKSLGKARYVGGGTYLCEHNNLKVKRPDLIPEWHENNKPMDSYAHKSQKKVWWRCSSENICNCHIWETRIGSRTQSKPTGCPFCSNMKLCEHNNLETLYSHLKKEWDPNNQKKMSEYPPHSDAKVNWVCSSKNNCGCHKWAALISDRTRIDGKDTGCPFCTGKNVCEHNNLKLLFPNLISEWDSRNGDMSSYSFGSQKKVWWKCSSKYNCGCHIWESTIANRTGTNKSGCPYCSNDALCEHNNLKVLFPNLQKEWHIKNKDMTLYPPASKERVFWICSINPVHEWITAIYHRTKKKSTGCPHCKISRSSKSEIAWIEEMEQEHGVVIRNASNPDGQFKIDDIGFVDGYCEETNTVFEYNGNFWHGNPSLYDREDINPINEISYGELYDRTIEREDKIRALGYNLIVKWETDINESDIKPKEIDVKKLFNLKT